MPNNRLSQKQQKAPMPKGVRSDKPAPDFIRNIDGHVPEKLGIEGANIHEPEI